MDSLLDEMHNSMYSQNRNEKHLDTNIDVTMAQRSTRSTGNQQQFEFKINIVQLQIIRSGDMPYVMNGKLPEHGQRQHISQRYSSR